MREMFHDFAQRDPPHVPGGTENLLLVSQSDFTRSHFSTAWPCNYVSLNATTSSRRKPLTLQPVCQPVLTCEFWRHRTAEWITVDSWVAQRVPCLSASAETFTGFDQLFLPGSADGFPYYSCAWMRSCPRKVTFRFLGRVRKIAKSDCQLRRVCPSVRMQQLGSNWTDFH